jgi:small subunit ribosomal protein S2
MGRCRTAAATNRTIGVAARNPAMSTLVQELIDAGIHFGQRRSNWNPRMAPYIWDTRNGISIIDIKETIKGLLLAKRFLQRTVAEGRDVVFVGTKRQAKGPIEQYAAGVGMPYVTERWLGGTLTNFRTIRDRLKRLEELERLMETGEIRSYSKKMESQLTREQKKIFRNLNGIRTMTRLPGAVVVVDVNRELNALREARNLGIPTVCLIDTDGNPEFADIPIPGNDDSMRSIDVVVRELCAAIQEGRQMRPTEDGKPAAAGADAGEAPRRRSSRSQFRAVAEPPVAEGSLGDGEPVATAE